MLKWEPKVSFEKGISLILENISYWKNAPLWNKKSIDDATKTWHQFMDK